MTIATVSYQGGPSGHPHPPGAESPTVPDELHALWSMTTAERVAAMWRGKLTLRQLSRWSSRKPEEVPLLAGEFAWIVMRTPDWAEAADHVQKAA